MERPVLYMLCVLFLLSMIGSAGALTAPATVVGNGGCIAIIPCNQDTTNVGLAMYSKLQSSDIWKKGGLGLRVLPLRDIGDNIGTIVYATKTEGAEFSDNDPFQCENTLLVELWTPSCGDMPKICTTGNDRNIVALPDNPLPDSYNPKKQYFFQDLDERGVSKGVFFKGAGFYMSCGNDENRAWSGSRKPRERVLIAGGTPAILEDVAMEFVEEVVKTKSEYAPEVKYRITDDWGQSMIVGFEGDLGSMTALKNSMKDRYGHAPIVVSEGKGMGDLAQVLLKPGRSGGGMFKLPSKMVDSRVYVVTSAKTAFRKLFENETDSMAYQLFANLNNEKYTDETLVYVDVYGCAPEYETFSITDDFKTGSTVAVKKGKELYIGENGIVCHFENKEKGACEALLTGEDEYEKGKGVYCRWEDSGGVKGNQYQTGVYSKKSVEGGGEIRLMAGLGNCSTHEAIAEYKTLSGAFDSGERQWLPLCNDSRRFPKDTKGNINCPYGESRTRSNGYGGSVFSRAKYCACGEIRDVDLKIMTGRFTEEAYEAGMGTEGGPVRLVAAIATLSGDVAGEPVEVESGTEHEIRGTGFRVRPSAIDADNRRIIPPEVTLTYKSLSREETKTSMNGKPVDFDIYFGGTLTMRAEGYPEYSVVLKPPLAGTLIYHPNKNDWIKVTDTSAVISWGISKADPGTTSRIHYALMPSGTIDERIEALEESGLQFKVETADFANGIWTVRLDNLKPDSEYLFWLDSNAIGDKESFFELADENGVEDWKFRTLLTETPREESEKADEIILIDEVTLTVYDPQARALSESTLVKDSKIRKGATINLPEETHLLIISVKANLRAYPDNAPIETPEASLDGRALKVRRDERGSRGVYKANVRKGTAGAIAPGTHTLIVGLSGENLNLRFQVTENQLFKKAEHENVRNYIAESEEELRGPITIAGKVVSRKQTSIDFHNNREMNDEELKKVGQLRNLEVLDLSGTGVSDITPLSGLRNLKWLWLYDTKVSDIRPLSGLRNLKRLDLSGTGVSREEYMGLKKALGECDISWSKVQ